MTVLLSGLLVAVFFLEYLANNLGVISRYATLIPEAFMVIVAIAVVGLALAKRRWEQPRSYAVIIVIMLLVGLISAVAEQVAPGPLVAGLRTYFKFVPLLFLAAAYQFNRKEIHVLLGTFLFLAAIQVPIAFFQRFVQFAARMHTGDPVSGTVSTSSALTVVLCIAIAIIITLYVNRKMSFPLAATLTLYFAAPTAINETKATLVLLPLATLGPFVFAQNVQNKWRLAAPVLGICIAGLVGFAAVYNILIEARWWAGRDIGDFITTGHFQTYLYRGASSDYVPNVIGRLDSIILPIQVLSENWMQLLFGLGPGNVSPAFLPGMEGAYYEEFRRYGLGMTSIGNIIWELGLLGLTVYGILFYYLWRYARLVAKSASDLKWIGEWWSVCVVLLGISLFYKDLMKFDEIGFLLALFGGIVGSMHVRMAAGTVEEETPLRKLKPPPKLQLAGTMT
jgi:hypothetical protein